MRYMRRRGLRMFAVAALLPMMAVAQSPKPASAQDSAVQEVVQTVRDFWVNIPTYTDTKPLREFFADDVIYTNWMGFIQGKADLLGPWDFRVNKKEPFEAENFTTHLYGDGIAVVNWLLTCKCSERALPDGKAVRVREQFRDTATLLKRNGKWQVVAMNETRVEHEQNILHEFQPPDAKIGGPEDMETAKLITQLVRDFLANVPRNDPRVFEDFFADDVIYTRATAATVTKADILKNIEVRASNTPEATFAADHFVVHTYGDLAIVSFRLIGHNVVKDTPTTYFCNTGTFLKRNGRWQAIAWQATKMSPPIGSGN